MITKAKKYRKIVKTSVSLSPVGCLSGWPGRRKHSLKESPLDYDYHLKRVLF